MKKIENKRGQIWIETVLYTLIGLAVIGTVLSFAVPKIREKQETILIDQTIESLHSLDKVIGNVDELGSGNVKSYKITMKRGKLTIDGINNKIIFTIDNLKSEYSEPDVPIEDGRITLVTTKGPSTNIVTLTMSYPYNIGYAGQETIGEFSQASLPYTFFVRNIESSDGGKIVNYLSIEEANGKSAVQPGAPGSMGEVVPTENQFYLGLWKFDDSSNLGWNSVSGVQGVVSGNPTWSSGDKKEGTGAIKFDGDGDYIKVPGGTNGLKATPHNFTVGGWFKTESYTNWASWIVKRDSFVVVADTNKNINFYIYKNGVWMEGNQFTGKSRVSNQGEWEHIVLTYDQHIARLYKNGDEISSLSVEAPIGSSGDMYIGYDPARAGSFNGLADNVRFYSMSFTPEQVNTFYSIG